MSDENPDQLVEYARDGLVATITLNRPSKLNAFDDEMSLALGSALRQFDTDPDAHVGILCGSGRAFCSGADVQKRQLRSEEEMLKNGGPQAWGTNANELLIRSVNWKPMIAAVHGYALGLGLGITLQCDLIVAEEGTKFQVTETGRGLAASRYWALLDYRGGGAFALEATLTGRFFTAEQALAANIINRVAERGTYLAVARELALAVAENPPLSVRATVRTRRWYMAEVERQALLQTDPMKLHLSEDFRESARAFVEKRKPAPYQGR